MQTPTHIQVIKLFHRDQFHIGLRFPYNSTFVRAIKTVEGRKYSKTCKCWYIPYTSKSFDAFKALELPYKVDAAKSKTMRPADQPAQSADLRLNTHIEQKLAPSIDSSPAKIEDKDILASLPSFIRFQNKAFLLEVPFSSEKITQLKKLKRTWWKPEIKRWIVFGTFENLTGLQNVFNCFSEEHIVALKKLIGAYEHPQKVFISKVPQTSDWVEVQLEGHGINLELIKSVTDRRYDKNSNDG